MSVNHQSVTVIGGGAAGCFCAIAVKRFNPSLKVTVLEAGAAPMAKLAITGGGRCNISNTFENVNDLAEVYPRGARLLKRLFYDFGPTDTVSWWENEGVSLTVEDNGRIFPKSQDALQVVHTLDRLMKKEGVNIVCNFKTARVKDRAEGGFEIAGRDGRDILSDAVILTCGGTDSARLRDMLPEDIAISPSAPSLFSFKLDDTALRELSGLSVNNACIGLSGTSLRSRGAVLVTDWGLSGPAVLRLSSYGARHLFEKGYDCLLSINWTGMSETETFEWIESISRLHPGKKVINMSPEGIPDRLWHLICFKAGLREDIRWSELGAKGIKRLTSVLTADSLHICGRNPFKEEFVTCGGVSLNMLSPSSLESKTHKGLFFAGEVLDIDGVTGGFNLQAAWSTAMAVASSHFFKIHK